MATAQTIEYVDQFGTSSFEDARRVAADSTGVYVVGRTGGALPGQPGPFCPFNAYIRKYDFTSGSGAVLLWTREFCTLAGDQALGVAVTPPGPLTPAVYVIGTTDGAGAFIRKYSQAGLLVWTIPFASGIDNERVSGVAADQSGVYVVGQTSGNLFGPNCGVSDAFVVKYDHAGACLWEDQFGTSDYDDARDVVVADSPNRVYVVGVTQGNLFGVSFGGFDSFIRKYEPDGTVVKNGGWGGGGPASSGCAPAGGLSGGVQFGSSGDDFAGGIAAGNGSLYVVGTIGGGGGTAFISKYNTAGTFEWEDKFGTYPSDITYGRYVAVKSSEIYVVGSTAGSPGGPNNGEFDAYIRKYNPAGKLDKGWGIGGTLQFGSPDRDFADGAAVDSSGGLYVVGTTHGSLVSPPGPPAGISTPDAFLAKIKP